MKDDGRIPRIKDTDMTDRLLTAGAIAEDTRNPIGDIAACFPRSRQPERRHVPRLPVRLPRSPAGHRPRRPAFPDMSWLGGNLNAVGLAITPIEARSKSVAGPSTPPIMGRCRDLRAGWRFSSVTAG